MKLARGLTLIEVLASVVLLTMLAGACLPLLQNAMRTLDEERQQGKVPLLEIGRMADEVIAEPEKFGFTTGGIKATDVLSLSWPDHPERGQIQVNVLPASDSLEEQRGQAARLRGSWVKFTLGDQSVWRWMHQVDDKAAEHPR